MKFMRGYYVVYVGCGESFGAHPLPVRRDLMACKDMEVYMDKMIIARTNNGVVEGPVIRTYEDEDGDTYYVLKVVSSPNPKLIGKEAYIGLGSGNLIEF